MAQEPRHRPVRRFPDAQRTIVECELNACVHCGSALVPRKPWHMRKYVQTMTGPLFVAGKSKECGNPQCPQAGQHYYASGVLRISLPHSTYGLDVLAYIGWQHDRAQRQLAEIQRDLNRQGILVNERNVGKLYRQFLALVAGASQETQQVLAATAQQHGGLIWAIDALQPEGCGSLLYVLYEVLSGTPVAALQADHPSVDELCRWLQPYQALPYAVLATLSDGEDTLIAALKGCWPAAAHQRCQEHALANIVEPVLKHDTHLRQSLRQDLGGLPQVPERAVPAAEARAEEPVAAPATAAVPVAAAGSPVGTLAVPPPPFCLPHATRN